MKHYLAVTREEVNEDRGSIELSTKILYLVSIYKRSGIVITFPVSDKKHETLIPLIKQYTKKGSL
jgi:hypothetical protein